MLSFRGHDFTKTRHLEPYPTISPLRPELSNAGKTIMVVGVSNDSIGYAIARAFIQASAAKVIITSRRQDSLDSCISKLQQDEPGSNTEIKAVVNDLADPTSCASLWDSLKAEGFVIDVLCLNAAAVGKQAPVLDYGTEAVWDDLSVNLRAQLYFIERLYKQRGTGANGPKFVVHTSSVAIHEHDATPRPAYSLTKEAGQVMLQLVAKDISPEQLQIVSFHPGAVMTAKARAEGLKEGMLVLSDVNLPGQFAVWAASSEARFLHGRFVWSEWDIDELRTGEIRKRIDGDSHYLTVNVVGL